jgi:predicted ATPase
VSALGSRAVRILTLIGPGGIGKTRLGIEAAGRLGSAFADGVCFVPLAVTRDPAFVPALIAREIGLAAVRKPTFEALRDRLRDSEMLLVLDTFEQVLPAAAFVAELAVACPRLAFLITSRAPLRLRGEQEVVLAPLALPRIDADPAEALHSPAVALFLDRARAVKPELLLDEQAVETIVQICRRLEGLPLALELAAARLRHLPLPTVEAALAHRLDLLVGGPRDLPARLQTMRDAIAWSYDLLAPRGQGLLRAVAVFEGGWTPLAARGISGDEGNDLLDELTSLVDNHLIEIDGRSPAEPRFRMLDVIREFAGEQSEANGEAGELAERHAALYVELAETAEREQGGAAQESWYRRLQIEQDNMRAALAFAVARRDGILVQRIAGALWLFWRRHGDYAEARGWLDRALAIGTEVEEASIDRNPAGGQTSALGRSSRRKVLWGDAWISYYQGDYAHVRRLGDELLAMAEQDADLVGIRNGLTIQALVAMAELRFDDALQPLEEGVRICRVSCPPWLLATSLLVLGQATLHVPATARSRALLREALSIYTELGDRLFVARTRSYLGYLDLLSGRPEPAGRQFGASLRGFRDLGERFGIAEVLQAVSAQRAAQGLDTRAAELAGAANAVWASMSAQALASDRPLASQFLDAAKQRLGSHPWRAAWQRGQRLRIEEAVALALERIPAPRVRAGRDAGSVRGRARSRDA